MKHRIRRIFRQLASFSGYYFLLALLCVVSSAGGLFVLEMMRGAAALRELNYIPYEGYYRLGWTNYNGGTWSEGTAPYNYLYPGDTLFSFYESVDDILVTTVMTAKANLTPFKTNFEPSASESAKFPFTCVPESKYDGEFREGKRILIAGRHIVRGDENVTLMDKQLAELNGLAIGDTFSLTDQEHTYTLIGLFETVYFNPYMPATADNPLNMLYVSDMPLGGHLEAQRDFYLSFGYPYSETKATEFLLQTLRRFNGDYVTHTVVSVNQLNRDASVGVTSMIRMSAACAVLLLGVVVAGLSLFITVLMKKRSREFQLMNALGKKKNAVIADFGAELALVMIPSLGIGLYASFRLLSQYMNRILAYFSQMVSVNNLQASSTFRAKSSIAITDSVTASLDPSLIIADAAVFLGLFLAVALVCLLVNRRAYVRTSVMQVLAER